MTPTSIDFNVVLLLMWMHFVADFVLQTNEIARPGERSWKGMVAHVLVYSVPFLWFGLVFAGVTFLVHIAVDAISSRVISVLDDRDEQHWKSVVVGLDHATHVTALIVTWQLLGMSLS